MRARWRSGRSAGPSLRTTAARFDRGRGWPRRGSARRGSRGTRSKTAGRTGEVAEIQVVVVELDGRVHIVLIGKRRRRDARALCASRYLVEETEDLGVAGRLRDVDVHQTRREMRKRDDAEVRHEHVGRTVAAQRLRQVPPRKRELTRAARQLLPLPRRVDEDRAEESRDGQGHDERDERPGGKSDGAHRHRF